MRSTLLFTVFFLVSTLHAQPGRDSLLRQWHNPALPDTVRLESMDGLIWDYYMFRLPDSAEYYAGLEYDFAAKQGQQTYMGYALNALGVSNAERGNSYKALDYHRRALELRQRMKDERGTGVSWNNLGLCYYKLGQYPQAIECYFKALKIREKIGDKSGMATSIGNIGAVYQTQGDLRNAMVYEQRALAIYDTLHNTSGMARQLSNLSFQYAELGDTATAIRYQLRSLGLYEQNNNLSGYSTVLRSLANIYADQHRYRMADSCAQRSLEIELQRHDSLGIMHAYYSIATNAYQQKNSARAIQYAKQALAIADTLHALNMQYAIGDFLYRRYKDAGNFPEALRILEKTRITGDSMQAQKLGEKIYKEQLKYDYEKKSEQLRAASIRRELRLAARTDEETLQRNRWIAIFIVVLALLAGGLFFYVRNARQKSVIAAQKNNLLKQQLLISQLNPHFIFNSLNAIQQFIFSQDSLQAGNYLGRFADLMRMILNFSREDFIGVEAEKKFLTEYLELQQLRFRGSFSYEIAIDPSIDEELMQLPPMLAQPFVENAIEHGVSRLKSGGQVRVRLSRSGNLLRYDIEDNGPGFAAKQQHATTRAHQPLATIITRERLDALGGTEVLSGIHLSDRQADGTGESGVHVWFTFPFQQTL